MRLLGSALLAFTGFLAILAILAFVALKCVVGFVVFAGWMLAVGG